MLSMLGLQPESQIAEPLLLLRHASSGQAPWKKARSPGGETAVLCGGFRVNGEEDGVGLAEGLRVLFAGGGDTRHVDLHLAMWPRDLLLTAGKSPDPLDQWNLLENA